MSTGLAQALMVGVGGFAGTLARYSVAVILHRVGATAFPYATLIVNLTGCALIGFVYVIADERQWISPAARLFLTVGVLGGFTTFSAFGQETWTLVRVGKPGLAMFYTGLSVVVGVLAVWAGSAVGRAVGS